MSRKHKRLIRTGNLKTLALLMLAGFAMVGCQSKAFIPDPHYRAVRPAPKLESQQVNGAIYQAGWDMRLFEDRRARRVGDMLTVQLSETTNATSENSTSTSRSSEINMANPTLLGTEPLFKAPGFLPLERTRNLNLAVTQSSDQTFDGQGSTEQSNSLTGFITVTVVEVLPNQNMVIRGEKLMSLNSGREAIRISGIVRPEDISPDNIVESTRIANVGISYTGRGDLANASAKGWLGKFFSSVMWFF